MIGYTYSGAGPRTIGDYKKLPEGVPIQLIDGHFIHWPTGKVLDDPSLQLVLNGTMASPAPRISHQRIVKKVAFLLETFLQEHQAGEVFIAPCDVYLIPGHAVQPDVLFVAADRAEITTDLSVEGAPDLVVEVLSPSTGYYDMTLKKRAYEEARVKEFWIIDPFDLAVTVYALEQGEYVVSSQARQEGTVASRLLGGFSVALAELFP